MRLTSGHLGTCVQVRTAAGVGTCFFRKSGPHGGFLSAAHVFKGVQQNELIYFRETKDWSPFTVKEIVRHPDGHDVCAFTLENLIWAAEDSDLRPVGMFPGDPVRFLGFPHGLSNTYPSETAFTTPLTRHAHLSGAIIHNGITLTVLDGFNNPGYSGGPVYADIGDGTPILIGIISGYRNELREKSLVYRTDGVVETEVDGLFVKPNSGMILAVQSAAVLDTFHLLHTSNAE
ncbi:serine protease [Sphingomonas morindae]|uniref:Serine protease n=1 Tax=Sphingomonas morindae TaxID=1541170 RepID=A0ABY4XAD3_9SPHN|nr:serine protease [Sphingomonas morindae]USI73922.1 serine protease [Sphingomonas morindae]